MTPTKNLNARVADAVTRERRKAGMTIADLAHQSGIADRTLNRKLGGGTHWTTDELDGLAIALGVPLSTLVS